MPGVNNEYFANTVTSPSALDEPVWEALRRNPCDANIISAHLLKALSKERAGEASVPGQLWILCGKNEPQRSIDLVLSCTQGPIAAYPIFIYSALPSDQLSTQFLLPRLERLVETLIDAVPVQRVFSVFALELITNIFVHLWSRRASVTPYDVPYYTAKLTFVTTGSLINRVVTLHPELLYDLRLAVEDDIPQAAALCFGFAQKSEPFTLTQSEALAEATILVHSRQLWVHQINRPGQPPEMASIVAVTRDSGPVAAISKVYTNPNWRQLGCAERLVRHVCKHLLASKERVILFVAHDNGTANGVYQRVGFTGLDTSAGPVAGVESWLEIGFDKNMVDLGHW